MTDGNWIEKIPILSRRRASTGPKPSVSMLPRPRSWGAMGRCGVTGKTCRRRRLRRLLRRRRDRRVHREHPEELHPEGGVRHRAVLARRGPDPQRRRPATRGTGDHDVPGGEHGIPDHPGGRPGSSDRRLPGPGRWGAGWSSVVAQYDYQGNLLAHVSVAGILGRSAVSPDGRLLALGVGGSSGACITISEPVLVDLQSLGMQPVEPKVPAAVIDDSGAFGEPWFLLTDLIWRDRRCWPPARCTSRPPRRPAIRTRRSGSAASGPPRVGWSTSPISARGRFVGPDRTATICWPLPHPGRSPR